VATWTWPDDCVDSRPEPAPKMDGADLDRGLGAPANQPAPKAKTKTLEAAHDAAPFHWHQYLKESVVGSAVYFDEGNGSSVTK